MAFPLNDSLAVQSWCFRNFRARAELIAKLKELGLDTIELCARHAEFGELDQHEAILRDFREGGVRIISIGVETIGEDAARARCLGEFARAAGARHISVDFKPEASPANWRVAEAMADAYDLQLGIHNHGGRHWLGSAQMLTHVLKNTSARIGLCIDTAWALQAGEKPLQWLELFSGRIYGLHLKDFVFDRTGKPSDVVLGTGNLDLPALLAAASELPKLACVIIEYEGDPDNPVPALKDCVAAVRGKI